MSIILHWFYIHENVLALIITAAVALLVVCTMECTSCPGCDKDDLFRRHNL